jgi:hypothetical protein
LDPESGVFGPEDIAIMNAAFEAALQKLGLINRDDPVVRVMAARIIAAIRNGFRDPYALCDEAVKGTDN